MMEIKIIIRDKIAKLAERYVVGVCGNSDYVINFDFDSEWDEYETKTARFKHSGTYIDVVFTGSKCKMPVIKDTYNVEIGVYAGDLHTTTSALLPMKKSILCGGGSPEDPAPDVYNQIMNKLNNLDTKGYEELNKEIGDLAELTTVAKENLVSAINEAAQSGGYDISLGLTSASVGQIIKVKAVDENGKPTEWEAADLESGEEEFELIRAISITESTDAISISTDENGNSFSLKGVFIYCSDSIGKGLDYKAISYSDNNGIVLSIPNALNENRVTKIKAENDGGIYSLYGGWANLDKGTINRYEVVTDSLFTPITSIKITFGAAVSRGSVKVWGKK